MEFFLGLQSYLYYCYSGCTLKSHDHLLFPECSMVTWPCHITLAYSVPILPFTPLYTWVFEMHGKPFSYSRFSQHYYTRKECRKVSHNKYHTLQLYVRISQCHVIWMESHDECGRVVHRPCSSCISSVQNPIETLSSSPCQLKLGVWLSCLRLSCYTPGVYSTIYILLQLRHPWSYSPISQGQKCSSQAKKN